MEWNCIVTRYWWVNQGKSYGAEKHAGILWAPMRTKDGRRQVHWETMDRVAIGDVIFHYADQAVQALSLVTSRSVPRPRPASLPADKWDRDGRLIKSNYTDITPAVTRDAIPTDWRIREPRVGPFKINTDVKVGYLYSLSSEFVEAFNLQFGNHLSMPLPPKVELPAEALIGATDLLRRLIGVPLQTLTGRKNVILGVTDGQAIVQTGQSPNGQLVPASDIQRGLDSLAATGCVTIHPDAVGYRSAFVGAVLSTLPGATWAGTPPVLQLVGVDRAQAETPPSEPTDESTGAVSFQGDLAVAVNSMARGEQARLRQHIFGNATVATCALCGDQYPVRFLWAAHIKRRAVCTDPERRDISNVAMAACVFGCDALFEAGHVIVDSSGYVRAAPVAVGSPLSARVSALEGRRCHAYTAGSSKYFEWHRENIGIGGGLEIEKTFNR